MSTDFTSAFQIITPVIYWSIALVWSIIFVLLARKFSYAFRTNGYLTLLVAVLAIDAIRTVIESLYFGVLFNSYFGLLRPDIQQSLQSPVLLAIPKLVNLASGILVLFLVVGRWLPSAQEREDATAKEDRERVLAFASEIEKERQSLLIAQSVAKVGSWVTNRNTLEVQWSAETFRIFEVDPATFNPTHQKFLELVDPGDRQAVDEAFRASFDSGEVCRIEHRITMPDGRKKHVVERWQTLFAAEGRSLAIGTCQDVSDLRIAEAKATEALELLNVASQAARLGGWSFHVATKQLTWSGETRKIHQVSDDYVPTLEAGINFYAPEFRAQIDKAFFDCLERGKPFDELLQIITAKGNRVWVKATGVPKRDDKGRITDVNGAIQDVSETIAREENLRLLETAISRLNDIVIVTDAGIDEPGPRIVFVNEAFQKITGYSVDEAIGKSPRFLQGPKTQRDVLDHIRRTLKTGSSWRGELLNYAKDGREYVLDIEVLPIIDARGMVSNFVAIERDITGRKKAALERAEISQRLDTMIHEAKVGILVHNNFELLVVNKELARILDYPSESELLEIGDARFIYADEEWKRISSLSEARMRGEQVPISYEVKGKKSDGSVIDLDVRAFPVKWGDEVAVCAMITDVTDKKKLEAQLRQSQRLEAVGQLTGGVAHDFNNLLTVILGNAEFLEEGLSDKPELQNMAELTRKAAERGADLTNRLLAFSRRQALDPKVIDLNFLITSTEALLRRALGAGIEIKTIKYPQLWRVLIDGPQFESAVLNLAVNARDAMPYGGCLTIETSNVEFDDVLIAGKSEIPAGHYVCFIVSDTGTGMDEETRLKVFEPFFTTKEVGKGSGLGLSMVYGLIKQSKGYIRIYSELGHGTTIKIYLPREMGDEDPVRLGPGLSSLTTGHEKILVVEDDDLVRGQVTSQLKALGYEIVAARNGVDALAILKTSADFDLIFTDVVMPGGINGAQLAEEALKIYPSLPVIFTSGYTENAVIHNVQLDREINLLNKPYRRHDLAAKIRAVLDKGKK